MCAHDERLYNIKFSNTKVIKLEKFLKFKYLNNYKLIAAIVYMKFLLPKEYFDNFYNDLFLLFDNYKEKLPKQIIYDILIEMGINIIDLTKLK